MAINFDKAQLLREALSILDSGQEKGALTVYNGDPNGNVTGTVGALCIDYSGSGKLWKNSNGSSTWIELGTGSSGGLTTISTKTTTYNANSNEIIPSDTSGGSFTITLPLTPTHGDMVVVIDVDGTFATNNLTVDRNGSSINGVADNVDLDINYGIFNFQFFTSFGWILT